jgi:hypothetical protein
MKLIICGILIILVSCCMGCTVNNTNVYLTTPSPSISPTISISSQTTAPIKPTEIISISSNTGKIASDTVKAQQSIRDAQKYLDQTDNILTFLKANRSISNNDPRLIQIINERDTAADLLTKANDALLAYNNVVDAQNFANQAYDRAKEAYRLAIQFS